MNYTPEARALLNLLNKYGSLTLPQIYKLFRTDRFNPQKMIAFLCKVHAIQFLEDNYAVLQNRPNYSIETLYCIWVMLDKVEKNMQKQGKTGFLWDTNDVKTSNRTSTVSEVMFISNNRVSEYLTYIDRTTIAKVSMIQDTFYVSTGVTPGNEKSSDRLYTFVVKDEEIMEIIGDMNLTIPYQIAYISGDLTGVPTIEYYELAES